MIQRFRSASEDTQEFLQSPDRLTAPQLQTHSDIISPRPSESDGITEGTHSEMNRPRDDSERVSANSKQNYISFAKWLLAPNPAGLIDLH